MENEIPVIMVDDDGYNYFFMCPFCLKAHRHGRSEGHKVAHCMNVYSPYEKTGYILRLRDSVTM